MSILTRSPPTVLDEIVLMNSIAVESSDPLAATSGQPVNRGGTSWVAYVLFFLLHLAILAVFFVEINATALILCGVSYFIQMFGITAGFHRYFSHRSFKTSRVFQFVLAWLGTSASQGGPSWWVSRHRHHHRASDQAEDMHSPVVHGFWWSHAGWILSRTSDGTDENSVKDIARYPELRWLDRHYWVSPAALTIVCIAIGGWSGLIWGFLISTLLSHHATFTVNSICHLWGRRRFETSDDSRNNLFVALITLGEGWHNNHHHYQSSAKQGFRWWEIDISYYVIRLLAMCRLLWDVRKYPKEKLLKEIGTGSAGKCEASQPVA